MRTRVERVQGGARRDRVDAAASSCPNGSSRPTPPGTGFPTWSHSPVAARWPGCRASRRTGCAGRTSSSSSPTSSSWLRAASTSTGRSRKSSRSTSAHTCSAHRRGGRAEVFAVDANGYFSRPGPSARRGRRAPRVPTAPGSLLGSGIPVEPRSGCRVGRRDVDPDLAVPKLGRVAPHRLLAVQARAGLEVEAPAVEGTDERRADDVSLERADCRRGDTPRRPPRRGLRRERRQSCGLRARTTARSAPPHLADDRAHRPRLEAHASLPTRSRRRSAPLSG